MSASLRGAWTCRTCGASGNTGATCTACNVSLHAPLRLTADTITDEHISKLIDFAGYMEWYQALQLAYVAYHGVTIKRTKRAIVRSKEGPIYRRVREQCAEIYNDNAASIERNANAAIEDK